MNNRLSVFEYNGILPSLYSYSKNSLFRGVGTLKKYASICDLSNSKYIKEVIDDRDRFILVFKNPISPRYIHATCFNKIDEYGNTKLLKIKDEYLDKHSIKPVCGIWFRKENNIKFEWDSSNTYLLGENLEDYDRYCHPNVSSWCCLGNSQRLLQYRGNDYIEYLINNFLYKPSYVNPFRDNATLTIDGTYLKFYVGYKETIDFSNSYETNIIEEIIMKYFEKPDIVMLS